MNIWKVTTVLFAGLFAATVAIGSVDQAIAENQPHMKTALGHLKKAKNQLQKASADKGGHRVKAIEHVDSAIDEVQAGIKFDNANKKQ
jgi:hypothetical protein